MIYFISLYCISEIVHITLYTLPLRTHDKIKSFSQEEITALLFFIFIKYFGVPVKQPGILYVSALALFSIQQTDLTAFSQDRRGVLNGYT